jgi:hypothetical protein
MATSRATIRARRLGPFCIVVKQAAIAADKTSVDWLNGD